MNITLIESVASDCVDWESYDLIILASGFEERSIHIAKSLPKSVHSCVHVFGFSNELKTLSRESNDVVFRRIIGDSIFVSNNKGECEREFCRVFSTAAQGKSKLRVFVDYSTMSRDWYGYILTWAKYQNVCTTVELDFAYSHGIYASSFCPLQISEIVCVPGFEGGGAGSRVTTALYGLGFDSAATLTVNELIEPDRVVCFLARGGISDPHADIVLRENREMVESSRSSVLELPISDIRRSTSLLLEKLSSMNEASEEILLVPMGPKTHVLACLLACHILPKIACLHAKGTRNLPVQVSAAGPVSISRVVYC
ncbi:hypothetical protein [Rhodoferax sp.]|uniref:hypothetical protein n=1 Tax=Rhodoferax sp. TaxID=50421 RepID=UPI0025CEFBBC|nr:hypothetical protein [Rhodoferax sp.]MCM2296603.1 hypothetical protein [Rhodoferax sp.]